MSVGKVRQIARSRAPRVQVKVSSFNSQGAKPFLQALKRVRGYGVGLHSYQESWLDKTSPFGETLYPITVTYAQLERGILRERVKAGMDRARRQGCKVGRPSVTRRPGFARELEVVRQEIAAGISELGG